jgi:hypothetical protein
MQLFTSEATSRLVGYLPGRIAWQIETCQGDLPGWIVAMADAIGQKIDRRGVIRRRENVAPAKLKWRQACSWAIDRAFYGRADGLSVGNSIDLRNESETIGLLILLASDADRAASYDQLVLKVGGLPACQLAIAVENAIIAGVGSIELEAQWWRPGAAPRRVIWRCYVDVRSRHRTFGFTAGKLVRFAVHLVSSGGELENNTPKDVPSSQERIEVSPALYRTLLHAARCIVARHQWAISVYQDVPANELWPNTAGIDLVPPMDRIWADPFLARDDGQLWVFLEEMPYATERGRIVCAAIDTSGQVSSIETALEEDCHLSYPNVFQYNGQWFMVPESATRRNVVLYRAVRLPGPWDPVVELISGVRIYDATIHYDGNVWWITASARNNGECCFDELHVYSATRLEGPWKPSPRNPVRVDPGWSRPAGPWFRWQNRWTRPVQDCRGHYGRAVQLLTVDGMSDAGPRESALASLAPRASSSVTGVHTYSRVGSNLAVDWARWRPRLASRRCGVRAELGIGPVGAWTAPS